MIDRAKIDSIVSWLIAGAQPPKSIDEIVEECALRLIDVGIPIDILIINGLFIHPQVRGIQIRWSSKRGRTRETFTHEFMESHEFHAAEVYKCMQTRRLLQCRIEPQGSQPLTNYLATFAKAGYSDIFFLPLFNFDGTVTGAIEVGTRHTDDFNDEHLLALRRVQAPLARMKEFFTEHFDKQITLATYVGEATSQKVLSGKIILGDGETISAVVLFADIVGFTHLSNSSPSEEVLKTLNTFFAAIDEAVSRNNGEILKFMGDGALIIFQTPDDLTAQEAAASRAVDAVAKAREILAQADTSPPSEFRAALHIGDVFYGNIGSGSRLDFTAIGPVVNLASRMLSAASEIDAKTVCSEDFEKIAIGLEARAVEYDLKGFEQPQKIYFLE